MLDLTDRPATAVRPWLAHYDPGVPAMLDYPAVPLDELLRRTAGRYPDRSALIFFGRTTSYRALDDAVDRVATALRRLGLERGDRVALFMPNCPQLVVGFYAAWRAGCVAVPMNPRATGPEVARYLSDSGAAAAIVLDRLWSGLKDAALPVDPATSRRCQCRGRVAAPPPHRRSDHSAGCARRMLRDRHTERS